VQPGYERVKEMFGKAVVADVKLGGQTVGWIKKWIRNGSGIVFEAFWDAPPPVPGLISADTFEGLQEKLEPLNLKVIRG
jgi:hypothetical protein